MSEKLDALKALLKQNDLFGFIVPHNDEYQEEITPPCFERLKWITGFSGDGGLAIIFAHKSVLLVDGRFSIQAREEVDENDFEILDVRENPLATVLEREMKIIGRLGYDPKLHTVKEVASLKKHCDKVGCHLVPLRDNLVDLIWKDRPNMPASKVFVWEEQYAGLSFKEKLALVVDDLNRHKQDALILDSSASICWLLNVRGADVLYNPVLLSYAIVHKNASVDWFIDSERVDTDVKKHLGDKVRILPPAIFKAELGRLAKKRIPVRLDAKRSSAWLESTLAKSAGNIALGDDPCVNLRAVKNKIEQNGFINAHIRDGVAVSKFLAWLYDEGLALGINEYRASQKLEEIRAEGDLYMGPSFATISAFGSNAAIVHYTPCEKSSRKLNDREVYLLDSGGHYLDGTTDITRTVSFAKVSYIVKRRFTQVLKGNIALASAVFPSGTYGYQLDTLARQFLWQDGVDFAHGTGHGVGTFLNVHEAPPSISFGKDSLPLVKGMVVTDEPGYYKNGDFGVRIENVLLVVGRPPRPDAESEMLGFEILTKVPIDTNLIVKEMLTDFEKAWINLYHKKVLNDLKPFVDDKTLKWLKAVTAEI